MYRDIFPRKPIIRLKNDPQPLAKIAQSVRELIVEKVDILANDPVLNDRHLGIEALNCVIES